MYVRALKNIRCMPARWRFFLLQMSRTVSGFKYKFDLIFVVKLNGVLIKLNFQ